MMTRTRSGVAFRVSAHPHGLFGGRVRWHVTVQRRHGVTKPTVHTEMVEGLLPPCARMRALAAQIADHGHVGRIPTPPRPRVEEPVTTLV